MTDDPAGFAARARDLLLQAARDRIAARKPVNALPSGRQR
jgi:hypothetical protein